MPAGFESLSEAQLHLAGELLDSEMRDALGRWWLPDDRLDARTPNWDIASTCSVRDRSGLVLVEAKAHDKELTNEGAGRRLGTGGKGDQAARDASHVTIGAAVNQARNGLQSASGLEWHISRDSHYQLSNRFAWAWKVASLGTPVILVYLGFLHATEMTDQGTPFASAEEWEALVKSDGAAVVPKSAWNKEWHVNGAPLVPLIRATEEPLPHEGPR